MEYSIQFLYRNQYSYVREQLSEFRLPLVFDISVNSQNNDVLLRVGLLNAHDFGLRLYIYNGVVANIVSDARSKSNKPVCCKSQNVWYLSCNITVKAEMNIFFYHAR